MSPRTVSDVLAKTAEQIEREGYWAPRRGGADKFSTYHCICQGARFGVSPTAETPPALFPAVIFFARFTGYAGHDRDRAIEWLNYDWDLITGLSEQEVVAKLREAASEAKGSQP